MELIFQVLHTYDFYYDLFLVHLAIGAETKEEKNYIRVQCRRILRLNIKY